VSWSEPDRIWVSEEYDLDGNEDGYLSGGGTPIDSDSADFNLGLPPFAGAQPDWQNYVLGGDIRQMTRSGFITSMSSRETGWRPGRPARGKGRTAHRRGRWRKSSSPLEALAFRAQRDQLDVKPASLRSS
jgi:hypothetical protein